MSLSKVIVKVIVLEQTMHRSLKFLLHLNVLFAAVCISSVNAAEEPSPAFSRKQQQFFAQQVQPLLKKKCLGCHGDGDKLESEFDMRSRAAVIEGGEIGPGAVPGQPDDSPIYQAVLRTVDLVMPPKERNKLSAAEIEILRQWIEMGMPWTDPTAAASGEDWSNQDGIVIQTSGGLDPSWTNRRYKPEDVWAYFPVKEVEPPSVTQLADDAAREGEAPAEPLHPIDAFVLRKLSEANLSPAPPATPRHWLRRATFDLTGLPPTPEEIAAFEARLTAPQREARKEDVRRSPTALPAGSRLNNAAIESAIDRLLASPHYGERMAQHWLDVVRYADTSGFSNDWERPHAWRYRDYVIRSFNEDKPYDRFVIEQIAGDELDASDSELRIAVGFLRMGPWEHTGMSVAAITRQQFLDDVTDSVGLTFLGQGMSCCKCHDHKFDPLPTRDYYRLQAVFATTQFDEPKTPFLPGESRPDAQRRAREIDQLANADDWMKVTSEKLDSAGRVRKKRNQYMKYAQQRFQPVAFSVRSGGGQKVQILKGGSLESPGETVQAGVLSAVQFAGGDEADEGSTQDSNDVPMSSDGRRLALARWIADERNPLTSRVIVNRVWQMHFGTGLVATPNGFGKMGARPSHPKLLDWLAGWFVENGWSIKKLHRLIMTSQTYQRSAHHPEMEKVRQADPKNQLLSYFPPRRLTAEEMRDAMLAVSGELNREMGGPGVFPEINWEVALQPRHIMGSVAPSYQPSPQKKDRDRRTIYAFRCRTLANPMLQVLNRPGPDTSCERRDETTVTPQVFALFNSENVHARALALAQRLMKSNDDGHRRIVRAFRLLFGRPPSDGELAACRAHVAKMTTHHEQNPALKRELPVMVEREMVDEQTGRPFRWEEKLHWLQDYERDLMPWEVEAETRALAEVCLVLLNSNEFAYVY